MARQRKAKKRPYGSGSSFENPDGTWTAQIYVNGRLTRRRCPTREIAEAKLAELNDLKRRGVNVRDGAQSFETFVNYWFNEVYLQRTLAARSIKHTKDMIELHLLPTVAHRPLIDIEHSELQTLLNDLRRRPGKRPLSAQTVNHVHSVLRQIFNKADAMHLLRYNPTLDLEIPKVKRMKKPALTIAQVRSFLEAIEGYRLATAYHVMATLGTRLGETLGLRRIDLNADFSQVTINQQISYHTREVAVPKQSSIRPLPVPPKLAARLRAQWSTVSPAADWQDHGLLFPSDEGTRKLPRNFEREWFGQRKKGIFYPGLKNKGGLPDETTIHSLRSFVATKLNGMDVNSATIGHILGHGAKNVTEGYIQRMLPSMRRALEALERELWGEGEVKERTGT